jgi:methionyl-tRNA formyltransferase|tara:strand:- start:15989 stop:16948 length:960 start_codon:yes stop_codon:yes gene_type:complete
MNNSPILPKIIFFGTPEFARYCLEALVEAGYPIMAVVTAPDRRSGRGKKINISAVKEYCFSQNLPLLQPENLKDPDFISYLKLLKPHIQVVVAFRMLPKVVWEVPLHGTINLHASLLPNYRGAAPINWVLINGDSKTGVSTFIINEQIDTGAILLQKEISITKEDNAGTLHDTLLNIGAPLIIKTLEGLVAGILKPKSQLILDQEKEAPKLTSENTRIDWTLGIEQIQNKIKGLSPYPGAWTLYINKGKEGRMKLFKTQIISISHNVEKNEIVIEEGKILIATKEGYLNCIELQLPNKKRMTANALLNGYSFGENTVVF